MSTLPPKRNKEKPQKRKCSSCNILRTFSLFYKVDSPMFPDGMINTCSKCIREQVDIEDMESVISFLRQIDKPFIQSYWDKSVSGGKYPLGTYIAKINSLHQVSSKNFDSSIGDNMGTSQDMQVVAMPDVIQTEEGEVIEFGESLVAKWGIGFKKHEYLQLEKFYQDMMTSYEVYTANHKQMLMKIAKISVEMDKLLAIKDYPNYQKVSGVYNTLIDSAGFAPKNKKNGADATGMTSFSQVWAEIEKEGFIPPKLIDYPKDDIDHMLMYYIQFTQRFTGREVMSEPNKNWRDEVVETDDNIAKDVDEDGE